MQIFASLFHTVEGKIKSEWYSVSRKDPVIKAWIFLTQPEEGIHFHLNRGMKLFFRPELTILHKTKKLYISMG